MSLLIAAGVYIVVAMTGDHYFIDDIAISASLLALIAFWLAQEMLCSIERMGKIYGQMINEATVSAGQAVELMGGP